MSSAGSRVGSISTVVMAAALVFAFASVGRSDAGAQEWSPPTRVYVEDAGHTVDGLFLDFWRANRALLGDPITEEFTQPGLTPVGPGTPTSTSTDEDEDEDEDLIVQYFENGAIAYLSENPPGEQVEMLPIGTTAATFVRGKAKEAFRPADGCGSLDAEVCTFVEETEHTVRFGFGDFWESGDGQLLLGDPISEEFVGEKKVTFQYFENGALSWTEDDDVAVHETGVDVAKRLKLDTKKVEPPNGLPVYDEALFVAPEPEPELQSDPQIDLAPDSVTDVPAVGAEVVEGAGPQQGGSKEIVISIGQQTLWAYEDGVLVTSTLVSTGTAETVAVETPLGYYSVLTKYDVQTMEGTISDEYYRVEDVPDVMYFDNLGNAIHGAYWHNNFGVPMSHGCVNVPLDIAAFLYDWAPIGTAVSVIP